MPVERMVDTPGGPARVLVDRSPQPFATLALGHGAGGGGSSPDLTALAETLPANGITVIRVEQPYRVAGRRTSPSPESLDSAWTETLTRLRPRAPLVVGGRSAGARVACRTARRAGASGCLALAFPLHPPGRPERSRLEELLAAGVTTLVVQGERDPFGRPEEFPEHLELVVVPGGDHSFAVPRTASLTRPEALTLLTEAVLEWITREVG